MSAQYASAAELLASLDVDDLSDVERRPTAYMFDLHRAQTHAVLALAEELEALVELLRERLPEPGDDGVARIVCAAHPGFPHTITLGVEEPRVYRPAGCTCVVTEPGARPYPLPSEWRKGCPAHPDRPDVDDDAKRDGGEPCGYLYPGAPGDPGPRCATPYDEHSAIRDHEWIRP